MSSPTPPLELHVWPSQWGLPSMDPTCLSLILYLQMILPSQFVLVETVNPDLSPSGQLPSLRHKDKTVAPTSSILSYLFDEANGLNIYTPALHASKSLTDTPWLAHAESNLGDLVLHTLYSLHANYNELTHPAIVYHFPIPQRYYAPSRLRQSFKGRLEAAGLWSLPGIEQEKGEEKKFTKERAAVKDDDRKPKPHDRFVRVFEREKVLNKARSILDIYARLLGQETFFRGERPVFLDAVIAAHILLLTRPPFPDALLQDLVNTSYPSLVAHTNRVYDQTLRDAKIPTRRLVTKGITSLLPSLSQNADEDIWATRLRFAFVGLTLGGLVTYLSAASRLSVKSAKFTVQ